MNKLLLLFCSLAIMALANSCQSCSTSGRNAMRVAMAQKEARKHPDTPTPESIDRNDNPEVVAIDDVVTPDEADFINKKLINDKIPPAEGELIQVEGLVFKEVTELTIGLKASDSQVDQIIKMRDYVKANWHYLYDPDVNHDSWRSAEATLSLKYNGKYTGDCDDFAILMASFARQIGLKAVVVGGFDSSASGHAFALFLLQEGYKNSPSLRGSDIHEVEGDDWVSLDWFQGQEHRSFSDLELLIGY
jgi:hypothetical protein